MISPSGLDLQLELPNPALSTRSNIYSSTLPEELLEKIYVRSENLLNVLYPTDISMLLYALNSPPEYLHPCVLPRPSEKAQ